MAFDDDTLQAIGELLALGEQGGFGITFTPDPEGWTVGYMRGMGGGDLPTSAASTAITRPRSDLMPAQRQTRQPDRLLEDNRRHGLSI